MSNVPEGAQRSEDGYWWWDGQQWQPTEEGVAAGAAEDVAGADSERVAARLANGYPASGEHLTDQQKSLLLAEPTTAVEVETHDEVEVLAMEDAGHENGEAMA